MTNEAFELWLQAFSPKQVESLLSLRELITRHAGGLTESINEGKWLNGYVFYSTGSTMVYAIGPSGKRKTTFHMMPFYGSDVLRQKHETALSPFLTGKSCIAFGEFSDLPLENLIEILENGTRQMVAKVAAPLKPHH